ncbi:MAG: hypothetical protein GDA52_09385 [Rhodobacteraceae bacterium]|nr:hypothetical protein [Paracoccaceae bacterium]
MASFAGVPCHPYLGQFDDVWQPRGGFALVFLACSAVFGTVYPALI